MFCCFTESCVVLKNSEHQLSGQIKGVIIESQFCREHDNSNCEAEAEQLIATNQILQDQQIYSPYTNGEWFLKHPRKDGRKNWKPILSHALFKPIIWTSWEETFQNAHLPGAQRVSFGCHDRYGTKEKMRDGIEENDSALMIGACCENDSEF